MTMKKFYNMPPSWNPGYAIPDYVMAEPPGRGTFTTKWLPRGSISTLDPSFTADPGKRLLGRTDAGLGTLGDVTIGNASSLAGHTLEGNSLDGDSLGSGRVYNLEPFSGPGDLPGVPENVVFAMWGAIKAGDLGGAKSIARQLTPAQRATLINALYSTDASSFEKEKGFRPALAINILKASGTSNATGISKGHIILAGAAAAAAYFLLWKKRR